MTKRNVLFGFLLWIVPFVLSSQRYISGHITDSKDGSPISAATVFFDNTTIGSTTDLNGHYQLRIPGEGAYKLLVSHVGYQSVFKDIEPGNSAMKFDAALQSIELNELNVATKIRFRQTDINLFWKTILGKNPSRRTIEATNPETVYYYYNPETRILKVTCREPLQIINNETGYQIHYLLSYFIHDYNTGITDWSHQCNFTEMEPAGIKQQKNWEKKRKEVYNASLTKFIKSLYNNTLLNDGFVLTTFTQNYDTPIILNPDSLLTTNKSNKFKTLYLNSQQVMLICYGRPVTNKDLEMIRNKMKFGLYCNLLQGDSIHIFSDGTYLNKISMSIVDNSRPINGLNMMLPVDYLPEKELLPFSTYKAPEFEPDFENIFQRLENQLYVFPQEKIHLHTDRDYYVPGEKIWFKAYLTDAMTHQYPTSSRYMYVELISPVDTLVCRVMIRRENDLFHGNIFLSEIIHEGNYTLRAYTRYMENLGDDFFFKKNIRIGNLKGENGGNWGNWGNEESRGRYSANRINSTVPTNLSSRRNQVDFEVSFYPEGGNLVEGVWNKVAFKALNRNGYPETIAGEIVDESGAEITSVKTFHAGMGVFAYTPEQGKNYYLKCRSENGLEKQFILPQHASRAYTLTASQQNKRILVGIRKSADAPSTPCYLLAHCRGKVLYVDTWNPKNETVVFSEAELPAGIIQFILFDEQMNPLSERLVFNKNSTNDVATIEFKTDKASYGKREKVNASFCLLERNGSEAGHFSVAITDDHDISVDNSTTILSTLLLSSELKGYIENPAWYLQDHIESAVALDYLMLTHGWRRYNVPEVVKGNPEYPQIPFQTSQKISGFVKDAFKSRPAVDSEVLIMFDENNFGMTSTDKNGRFLFHDFDYPDSISFYLRALNNKGSEQVELVLDTETFPEMIHAPQSPVFVETDNYQSLHANAFIAKAEQRSKYDQDMWLIQLGEIEVTASKIERKIEPRLEYWANSSADKTVRNEEIIKLNYSKPSDYIKYIKDKYFNRGPTTMFAGSKVLILIDGFPIDSRGNVDDFLVSASIESFDIFNGASATVFGVLGGNGAISITTKKGGENNMIEKQKSNYITFTSLGYQNQVEFYSPKYEALESRFLTIPDYRTTIFWKPDIVISEDEEEANFSFYASDFPTTYSVVIEGITSEGRIVRQVEKIQIE